MMIEEIKAQPPHPVPDPENPFIHAFYRIPILPYRLGLY